MTRLLVFLLALGWDGPQDEKRAPKRPGGPPPACNHLKPEAARRPKAPAPRTMPEMFQGMMQKLANNPATGFSDFVNDLSRMDESVIEGVTLSAPEERQAGREALKEYLDRAKRAGYVLDDDPGDLAYLEALIAKAVPHMKNKARYPKIEVHLIDAPIPDGQSFPGGYLVFTRGLLKEPDEATVFGVVAHELAHLDRGHLYGYARRAKAIRSRGMGRPDQFMDFDRMFARQFALLGMMLNPYRPEHEHEADCQAATWMYLEGYDPVALVGFFERLHARVKDQPANPFFNLGRSHPFSLERKRAVAERSAQLRRWWRRDDLARAAENLRKRKPYEQRAGKGG